MTEILTDGTIGWPVLDRWYIVYAVYTENELMQNTEALGRVGPKKSQMRLLKRAFCWKSWVSWRNIWSLTNRTWPRKDAEQPAHLRRLLTVSSGLKWFIMNPSAFQIRAHAQLNTGTWARAKGNPPRAFAAHTHTPQALCCRYSQSQIERKWQKTAFPVVRLDSFCWDQWSNLRGRSLTRPKMVYMKKSSKIWSSEAAVNLL